MSTVASVAQAIEVVRVRTSITLPCTRVLFVSASVLTLAEAAGVTRDALVSVGLDNILCSTVTGGRNLGPVAHGPISIV
jgi:hypothetical protein